MDPRQPRPNTLSGEARPNVLSIESPVAGAPRIGTRNPVASAPVASGRPAPSATPGSARRSGGRLANRLLVIVGILAFAYARLGGLVSAPSGAEPTTAPIQAGPTAVPAAPNPGPIEFGTNQGAGCVLSGTGSAFPVDATIRWWAHLSISQGAGASLVWLLRYEGAVIDTEKGPTERPTSSFDGLCGGEALPTKGTGLYKLEVWNGDQTVELAAGEFELVTASPSPS